MALRIGEPYAETPSHRREDEVRCGARSSRAGGDQMKHGCTLSVALAAVFFGPSGAYGQTEAQDSIPPEQEAVQIRGQVSDIVTRHPLSSASIRLCTRSERAHWVIGPSRTWSRFPAMAPSTWTSS